MAEKQMSWNHGELENSSLFTGVDLESIREILKECPVNELHQGDVLIRARERNEFLYVLLSGSLRVHLNLNMSPMAVLDPGEVVGELSIIDRQLTSAYVIADDVCRVLEISAQVTCKAIYRRRRPDPTGLTAPSGTGHHLKLRLRP